MKLQETKRETCVASGNEKRNLGNIWGGRDRD